MAFLANRPQFIAAGVESAPITLDRQALINELGITNPSWNVPSQWTQVQLIYRDATDSQQVNLVFGATNTASFQASRFAHRNLWALRQVVIYGPENSQLVLERTANPIPFSQNDIRVADAAPNSVIVSDADGNLTSLPRLDRPRGGSGRDNSNLDFPASGDLVTTQVMNTALAAKANASDLPSSTDELPEGSNNRYFTDDRADARIAAARGTPGGIASLGSDGKIPATEVDFPAAPVRSVNSQTGDAVLSTDDIQEGSANRYYTDGRADARFDTRISALSGVAGGLAVLGPDGKIPSSQLSFPPDLVTSVNGQVGLVVLSSDDVNEGGTNLYHTDARAKAAAVVDSLAGTQVDSAPSVAAVRSGLALKADLSAIPSTTDSLAEGVANKYFTDGRADTRADLRITTQKGVATGLATLDATAKVPMSQMPQALLGATIFQTTWNAATNTPVLASGVGTKGHYYIVETPGATDLDGITDWKLGDWAVYDGTAWRKVDNTDAVISVNGQIGSVLLGTDQIGEGTTNMYHTSARVDARIALQKGAVNGLATLDATGKIPSAQIPTLNLGTLSSQDANAVAITGGTLDNILFDGGSY